MKMEDILTLEYFKQWLLTKKPTDYVGFSSNPGACPVAHMCNEIMDSSIVWTFVNWTTVTRSTFYIDDPLGYKDVKEYSIPRNLSKVIMKIDDYPKDSPIMAYEILSEIIQIENNWAFKLMTPEEIRAAVTERFSNVS